MFHLEPCSDIFHGTFLSQFFTKGTQARDDIATEAYEEELDIGRSGSYLNNSITSAWSEHSLDPDDIRVRKRTRIIKLVVACFFFLSVQNAAQSHRRGQIIEDWPCQTS